MPASITARLPLLRLAALLLLLAGTGGWLAGHLHYRLRHGDFKSGLAGAVLGRGL